MIEEQVYYVCSDCGKIYDSNPQHCECETKLAKGRIIGPFEILDATTNGSLTCQCRLCGLIKDINSSNIRKQSSCGCKPRSAQILQFMTDQIRYKCRRCNKTNIDNLPIDLWCCHDEDY